MKKFISCLLAVALVIGFAATNFIPASAAKASSRETVTKIWTANGLVNLTWNSRTKAVRYGSLLLAVGVTNIRWGSPKGGGFEVFELNGGTILTIRGGQFGRRIPATGWQCIPSKGIWGESGHTTGYWF